MVFSGPDCKQKVTKLVLFEKQEMAEKHGGVPMLPMHIQFSECRSFAVEGLV